MEELLANPELLSLKNSVAGIVIIGAGHLILKIALVLYNQLKKKADTSEDTLKLNTAAIEKLTQATESNQVQSAKFQVSLDKYAYDLQKVFYIMKQDPQFNAHLKKFKEEEELNK